MHPDDLRILPHSIEAEQSVIGGILLNNQSYIPISERLSDTDFYRQDHQRFANGERAANSAAKKGNKSPSTYQHPTYNANQEEAY